MVEWDLQPARRQTVETLPHPNIHMVAASGDGTVSIHGVQTRRFERLLEGHARVFGVKFRPGGFYSFLGAPVSTLRDKTIDARSVFGDRVAALQPILSSDSEDSYRVEQANQFFLSLMPKCDPDADSASRIADLILNNSQIRNVSALSATTGLSVRSLQRLFQRFIGVSPKWVICRYRMHELVELLNRGEQVDWAAMAAELGYFDQSHLIRDFRRNTGWTPEKYRLRLMEQPPSS